VTRALETRLAQERRLRRASTDELKRSLREIAERAASYPVLDPRSEGGLLGCNELGTFD
jgi:hypothetical protein